MLSTGTSHAPSANIGEIAEEDSESPTGPRESIQSKATPGMEKCRIRAVARR